MILAGIVIVAVVFFVRNENQKTRATLTRVGEETRQGINEAREMPSEILQEMIEIIKDGGDDESVEKENTPDDLVSDLFDLGREVMKTADDVVQEVMGLDVDEERKLGAIVNREVRAAHRVVDPPGMQQRIEKLAEPLLASRDRKGIEYTFTIVEDESVNAFALPGGYIYLHTGILDFVANDVELQSILGHEIGHVDLKHCVNGFTAVVRSDQISGGVATIPVSALYNFYHLQFSEEDEFAADKYSYLRMRKLGHSKEAALSCERHMIEYHESLGITNSEDDPDSIPEVLEKEFHDHFRTHPPSRERLKMLERITIPGIDD